MNKVMSSMSSKEALGYFYGEDAWNSLGHPRVIQLNDGREAVTWCESGFRWDPGDERHHNYTIYIKGVDY